MKLVQVLSTVLTELSIGTLLMTCLLPPREIRTGFFTFNSLLSALAAAVALVLSKTLQQSAWWDVRYLGLTVIGATLAWGAFRLDKVGLGRLLLIASGLFGLVFGLLPLVHHTMAVRGIDTQAPGFFDAGVISATLLLGATNVGMILGHWYLLMRRLSYDHLLRFAQIVLGAVALRILVVLFTVVLFGHMDPEFGSPFVGLLWSPGGNLLFFLIRIVTGLVAPLVLAILVLRCVQEKANQAATGMLYVVAICVLFGELFAAYLLI